MNKALLALLMQLLNRKCIGGKHKPEKEIITAKIRWLSNTEKREFDKEYRQMVNDGIIMKMMKRTGKGDEWHISLNPSKLKEIYGMIGTETGERQ